MSSAVTRASQKWKEFWGSNITKNAKLEEAKLEVNELDQYFRMIGRTYTTLAQLHSQYQLYMNQLATVVSKIYEHETGPNKEIGSKLVAMFSKLSELNGIKIEPIGQLVIHIQEWFQTIDKVKILLNRYEDDRLVFDHYKQKVEELRSESEQKGGKIQDKYQRNQNKFNNSTTQFNKITQDILLHLNNIKAKKFKMINASLQELIENELELNKAQVTQYTQNSKLIEKFNDKSDNIEEVDEQEENDFIIKTRQKLQQSMQKSKQNQKNNEEIRIDQQIETPTENPDFTNQQDPFADFQKQQQEEQLDTKQQSQSLSQTQQKQIVSIPPPIIPHLKQQAWNPFDENGNRNEQNLSKNIPVYNNPFDEPTEQQTQHQISNNPFDDQDSITSIPSIILSQRQYQTYGGSSNPFDDYKQFQTQSKNPFD